MKSWKNKNNTRTTYQESRSPLTPRDQALKDGTLIDVSNLAETCGITAPIAITAEAYRKSGCSKTMSANDISDRIYDVVYLLSLALRRDRGRNATTFSIFSRKGNKTKEVKLKAVSSPDLIVAQVFTIMLEKETLNKIFKS